MTSSINTGSINTSYPTPGVNNSSQGLRDNFTGIKDNFEITAQEISNLQSRSLLKSALPGTTLDNDMSNGIIKNVKTIGFRSSTYNLGTNSGTINIDLTLGDVQLVTLSGNSNITFSKWAPAGTQSAVEVILVVQPGQVISLPYTSGGISGVVYGTSTIENYSLSGNISNITVPRGVTRLHYRFTTVDCGDTIEIAPIDRPRKSTQVVVGTPTPTGNIGDMVGDVLVDQNQIWYCSANYNGVDTIWHSTSSITTVSQLINGTSNITVVGNGPLNFSSGGVANILSITNSSANLSANMFINGNITVSGTSNFGDIDVSGNVYLSSIDASGASNFGDITVSGTSDLGDITNITITGGTTGQVLSTDGSGVLSWSSPTTQSNAFSSGLTFENDLTSTTGNISTGGDIVSGSVSSKLIMLVGAPINSNDTGIAGQIAYDADYVYVCIATGTWKRSPLTTW